MLRFLGLKKAEQEKPKRKYSSSSGYQTETDYDDDIFSAGGISSQAESPLTAHSPETTYHGSNLPGNLVNTLTSSNTLNEPFEQFEAVASKGRPTSSVKNTHSLSEYAVLQETGKDVLRGAASGTRVLEQLVSGRPTLFQPEGEPELLPFTGKQMSDIRLLSHNENMAALEQPVGTLDDEIVLHEGMVPTQEGVRPGSGGSVLAWQEQDAELRTTSTRSVQPRVDEEPAAVPSKKKKKSQRRKAGDGVDNWTRTERSDKDDVSMPKSVGGSNKRLYSGRVAPVTDHSASESGSGEGPQRNSLGAQDADKNRYFEYRKRKDYEREAAESARLAEEEKSKKTRVRKMAAAAGLCLALFIVVVAVPASIQKVYPFSGCERGFWYSKTGSLLQSSKCQSCPVSSYSRPNSTDITQCYCNGGFYGTVVNSFSVCTPCDRGLWTPTQNSTLRKTCLPVENYWRIGRSGQTCADVCKAVNRTSDPDGLRLLNTNVPAVDMMRILDFALGTKCSTILSSHGSMGPYQCSEPGCGSLRGACFYPAPPLLDDSDMGTPGIVRRFCACVHPSFYDKAASVD